MPWKGLTVVQERCLFVSAALECSRSFSETCRLFGISRKTGYKWLERSRLGLPLDDRPRTPASSPSRTPPEVEELILSVRDACPAWGGAKIKAFLEAQGCTGIPSVKTCANILKRNGRIDPRASLEHRPCTRFEREHCNELWQMDYKGDFALQDGQRCYTLDIIDDHSRFAILVEPNTAATGALDFLKQAFREYGLPDAILSDNGTQFAGFKNGITKLERYLMDLDILPIHGRVMHPQTQGKIERFHRTMKAELLREPMADLRDAQKRMAVWRMQYNELRPHHALGLKTPAEVYEKSRRKYREPEEYEYPAGARVKKLDSWGYLRYSNAMVYISETFRNTYLELRQTEDGRIEALYRNYVVAEIDASTQKLVDRKIRKV